MTTCQYPSVSHGWGRLIVISAPSGAGKTTLVERLLERNRNLVRSVSYTTRLPRAGETNGKDYSFVSKDEFREKQENGFFLESADVFGHLYGTSRELVMKKLAEGRDVILAVDVQGMKQLRKTVPSHIRMISIFIMPPSQVALRRRLNKRKTETKQEVNKRLRLAEKEMRQRDLYDHVVINKRIDQAVKTIEGVLK